LTDAIVQATNELLEGFVVAYRSVNSGGVAAETSPAR
jgi:hypothetical protein